MTPTPFSKGHNPALLAAALKTPNRPGVWGNLGLTGTMRLVSPRAALLAKTAPSLPPPPADGSRTTTAELLEIALAVGQADTPFHLIQSQTALAPFAAELQGQAAFRFDASHVGPYVSQLLLRDIPINGAPVPQLYRIRTGFYGTTTATNAELLAGRIPEPQLWAVPLQRINTPRALASAMHQDPPYLLALHAAFVLAAIAQPSGLFAPGPHEIGFVSDGGPVQLHCLLPSVVQSAMRATWLAKFQLYRRRRPEELFADQASLHPDWQRLALPALQLPPGCLPRLYAEGCPLHSDYPSGHAVIGGAAATILKAWFADGPWPSPVESRDGISLEPVTAPLTIHGEIDKLASNYGWGRNFAGIHYRSSCRGGMLLGEAMAIQALRGISGRQVQFRGFSGATVTAG